MRVTLFLALVLTVQPVMAQCPGGACPAAATSGAYPPTASVFLGQAALAAPATPVSPASAESTLPTPLPASADQRTPPAPPPVTYEVWGYHWNGSSWDQPEGYRYKTTDFQKAADYLYEVATFGGWFVRINCDTSPFDDFEMSDPLVPVKATKPSRPAKASFTIWAYKLVDGKWQKQDACCGTSSVLKDCQKYIANVNAVPGWCAVSNCPPAKVTPSNGLQINGPKTRGIPSNYVYKGNGRWDYYYQTYYTRGSSSGSGSSNNTGNWDAGTSNSDNSSYWTSSQFQVNQALQNDVDMMNAYNRNMENP